MSALSERYNESEEPQMWLEAPEPLTDEEILQHTREINNALWISRPEQLRIVAKDTITPAAALVTTGIIATAGASDVLPGSPTPINSMPANHAAHVSKAITHAPLAATKGPLRLVVDPATKQVKPHLEAPTPAAPFAPTEAAPSVQPQLQATPAFQQSHQPQLEAAPAVKLPTGKKTQPKHHATESAPQAVHHPAVHVKYQTTTLPEGQNPWTVVQAKERSGEAAKGQIAEVKATMRASHIPNERAAEHLLPGRRITMPVKAAEASNHHEASHEPATKIVQREITVQQGDCLSVIAQDHDETLAYFLDKNPHYKVDPNFVPIGARVKVNTTVENHGQTRLIKHAAKHSNATGGAAVETPSTPATVPAAPTPAVPGAAPIAPATPDATAPAPATSAAPAPSTATAETPSHHASTTKHHNHHKAKHHTHHAKSVSSTSKHKVMLNVSSRVGHGITKKGQYSLQKATSNASNNTGVAANLIASFYYAENARYKDSRNNADSASGTPVAGNGIWRDPAAPFGHGAGWDAPNAYSATGPWQFITSTWDEYKVPGMNDTSDRDNLNDSALVAGRYLRSLLRSAGAHNLSHPTEGQLQYAAYGYNHSYTYAQSVINTYHFLNRYRDARVVIRGHHDHNASRPINHPRAAKKAGGLATSKAAAHVEHRHHRHNRATTSTSSLANKLAREAVYLSWKAPIDPQSNTPQFGRAIAKYNPSIPYGGKDCEGLVVTVERAIGMSNVPSTYTTPSEEFYLSHPNEFKLLHSRVTSTSQLVTGGIMVLNQGTTTSGNRITHVGDGAGAGGHTWISIGKYGKPYGQNAASASGGSHSAELETYDEYNITQDARGLYAEFIPIATNNNPPQLRMDPQPTTQQPTSHHHTQHRHQGSLKISRHGWGVSLHGNQPKHHSQPNGEHHVARQGGQGKGVLHAIHHQVHQRTYSGGAARVSAPSTSPRHYQGPSVSHTQPSSNHSNNGGSHGGSRHGR